MLLEYTNYPDKCLVDQKELSKYSKEELQVIIKKLLKSFGYPNYYGITNIGENIYTYSLEID